MKHWLLLCIIAVSISAKSQLIVGEANPYILVTNVLMGKGIATDSIIYTGHSRSCGFFENGLTSKLKMDAGIILSTGIAVGAKGPNDAGNKSTSELQTAGSALLNKYASQPTYDAATLQFKFTPQTEDIVFNYIFASEEYIEFVDQNVSDIFGFFISGPGIVGEQNVALVPGKTFPVSIDNINHLRNSQFFNLNLLGEKTLQADGYTTHLTANLKLEACSPYTIKLAIADVGDFRLDSYVFIEAGSFQHKTSIGKDTFICKENFDLILDAGNPGRFVEWYKDGVKLADTSQKITVTTFGTYEVKVFTNCGYFIDVKKILPGVADISIGKDTLYCGDSLHRILKIKNRVFDSYQWSNGSTADTLIAKKTGLYWLEIDRNGCKKRDTINLVLEPLPKINLGADTTVCGQVDIILRAKELASSYTWYKDGLPTGDTLMNLRATQAGTYCVWSRNKNCSNRDTLSVFKRKALSVDLGSPLLEICNNDTFYLKTNINDTLNYSTLWNTGAISSTILISSSGKYLVTVRDKLCNFKASDSVEVKVYEGAGNVSVANAFTPTHDGLNEEFKPVSDIESFTFYRFVIFNRWGQKLFETSDPNKAWNGFYENKLCENGVYIWSLHAKSNCSAGDKNFQKGIVHLIR